MNYVTHCFLLRLTNLLKQPDRLYVITSRLHNLLRSYGFAHYVAEIIVTF
jgi:hypothetical protein